MRKKVYALIIAGLSLLLPLAAAAQTAQQAGARVVITFGAAPAGDAPYQLPYLGDDIFAIRISKALAPAVQSSVAVSRRSENGDLTFSFRITPGSDVSVNRISGGLEITFVSSEGTMAGAASAETVTTVSNVPQVVSVPSGGTTATTGGAVSPAPSSGATAPPAAPGGIQGGLGGILTAFLPDKTIKRANIDLSVPESPAFTVLGLTPQTVVRPATPREFGTSLLNGLDANGNFQSGVAIDTAPFLLLAGNNLTINDYRKPNNYVTRLLARTQMSFAATKGASDDDKSVRLALGLNLTLFDKGDPRLDRLLDQCFADKILPIFNGFPPLNPLMPEEQRNAEIARRTELLKGAAEPCRAESRKRNWNRTSWLIAGAPSWISPSGSSNDFQWNGAGAWTSFAYGFEGVDFLKDTSQLIFHARYRNREMVPDPDNAGKFFKQDSLFFGTRLRIGRPDFSGNFEGVYINNRPTGRAHDTSYRFTLGVERKLSDNLFFVLSAGGEGGHRDGDQNKALIISSFRWGFSRESSF